MDAGSVNCCVTSPPYFGLRDYGHACQIGLEPTPDEFVAAMVEVFREVRRVLRDDGTLWLNLGDSYAAGKSGRTDHGSGDPTSTLGPDRKGLVGTPPGPVAIRKVPEGMKQKDLCGIPWMVAFALRADGWYLRQDIIWHKPNPMPESVTDRCTKAHEYIFLLSKGPRYFFDAAAIAEPLSGGANGGAKNPSTLVGRNAVTTKGGKESSGLGMAWDKDTRNKRSVWTVNSQPFADAHFATYPPDLIEPCILAGCPVGGTVLDPFGGAGTTGLVADRLGRNAVLCELNPAYAAMAERRLRADGGMFIDVRLDQPQAIAAE